MAWTLKPKLPTGSTFNGEIVFNSVEFEIPDTFKYYVESVDHSIYSQYENKYTGFETKKYSKNDSSQHRFMIMLVGDLPRWVRDSLHSLAIAVNGAGMIIQFDDTWITSSTSEIYDCRWVNAGDFVDNSELLNGGSMELISYTSTAAISVTEYQKTINNPGLEWELKIADADATEIYYRVA